MKQILQSLVLVVLVGSTSACSYVFGQTVKLKVEDQKGKPVPEAEVTMAFLRRYDGERKDGITNDEGVVKMRGSGDLGIDTIVAKTGYYKSEIRITGEGNIDSSILLREKKNPVPMYVKEVSARVPEKGRKIGFDLEKADWVSPYGSGAEKHINFELSGYNKGLENLKAHLKITFPNPESGIKELRDIGHDSVFKFPYKAPREGYREKVENEYKYEPVPEYDDYTYKTTMKDNPVGYIFKIVSNSGEESEVRYGRILGIVDFAVSKAENEGPAGTVWFTYYFNPQTNDRNLEFDPRRNLFKDAEKTYPP